MKKVFSVLVLAAVICSTVCVTASAQDYLNLNFDSDAGLADLFDVLSGDSPSWKVEGGKLIGETLVMNTHYDEVQDDPDTPDKENNIFLKGAGTWVTYDAMLKVSFSVNSGNEGKETNDIGIPLDDEGHPINRSVYFSYVNDNKRAATVPEGEEEAEGTGREFIDLVLDLTNQEILFADGGAGNSESMLADPVPFTIDATGKTFYNIGISVDTNHIRYFINDQMVFELQDTEHKIAANNVPSPLFIWNNSNLLTIEDIRVTDVGELFPLSGGTTPTEPAATEGPAATENAGTDAGTEAEIAAGTEAGTTPPANTANTANNNNTGSNNSAAQTGDNALIVVLVAAAAIGSALIVKKVNAVR